MGKLLQRLHAWANKHEWVIFLVLLVIILRIPSLFTPHYYGDEEIYFVMGRAWREGIPLYKAMFDHKPPLIYILAGIANTVFWFRFALLTAMVTHTILFWHLARKFWAGKRAFLPYVSSFLFVVLTTLPTFEGLITNAELLMMLPVTASLLMIWPSSTKEHGWQRYLLAGLIAGIGWLFKIPVVTDVVAIALYLFAFQPKTFKGSLRGVFSLKFWLYLAGFAAPLAASFAYYYLKGSGPDYLATVVTVNLGYVSSWSTSSYVFNPLKSGLAIRTAILGAVTLVMYLLRHKLDKRLVFATLWFAFSFYGALLSDRPYPHYLQEPIVPFALLLPCIFAVEHLLDWLLVGAVVAILWVTERQIQFWVYPIAPVYVNFFQLVTGKITEATYIDRFGVGGDYQIAAYLNERLAPGDQIYIWGTDPSVYNLTNRLPSGGKYIVSFHVQDLNQYDYTMANLSKNKPRYIIVLPGGGTFPALSGYLASRYLPIANIQGATIYLSIIH